MASFDHHDFADRMSEIRIESLKQQLYAVGVELHQASFFPYPAAMWISEPLEYAAKLLHKDIEIEELKAHLRESQQNCTKLQVENDELERRLGMRVTNIEKAQSSCLELMLANEELRSRLEKAESQQSLNHKWACRSATDLGSILRHVDNIKNCIAQARTYVHGAHLDHLQYVSWLIGQNQGHLLNAGVPATLQCMESVTESLTFDIGSLETSIRNVNVQLGADEFVEFSVPAWKDDRRIAEYVESRIAHANPHHSFDQEMNTVDRVKAPVANEIAKSKSQTNGNQKLKKIDQGPAPKTNTNITLPYHRDETDNAKDMVDFSDPGWKADPRVVSNVVEEVTTANLQSLQAFLPLWKIGFAIRSQYLERQSTPKTPGIINEGFEADHCGAALVDASLFISFGNVPCSMENESSYSGVYGISPMKVFELRHCVKFIQMLSQYASVRGWNRNNFENTDFSKSWPQDMVPKYMNATPEEVAQDLARGKMRRLVVKLNSLYLTEKSAFRSKRRQNTPVRFAALEK